jgi:hypothetical protein
MKTHMAVSSNEDGGPMPDSAGSTPAPATIANTKSWRLPDDVE